MFFSMLKDSLTRGQPFNQSAARQAFFNYVELPFTLSQDSFPPHPVGKFSKKISLYL